MSGADVRGAGIPALDDVALRAAVLRPGGLWRELTVVPATGSTNTDLVARAAQGSAEGTVLVTEHQQAGRGRLDRGFLTPPRVALTFSVLLRPDLPPARRGWLPLLVGLAVVRGVARVTGLPTRSQAASADAILGLKWPNDVLLGPAMGERKLAGILTEAAGMTTTPIPVVTGVGLNVHQEAAELPTPHATSLFAQTGVGFDRGLLLQAVLEQLATEYETWRARGGDVERSGLRARYRAECVTLGRRVRVHLPARDASPGRAEDIDGDGRLVVRHDDGELAVYSAGDIVHLR